MVKAEFGMFYFNVCLGGGGGGVMIFHLINQHLLRGVTKRNS